MFHLIDLDNWERREQYQLYTELWQGVYFCSTRKLDVAPTVRFLKERGIKFVPAVIYLISREINGQSNLRMGFQDGRLGFWDEIHPIYPVLNGENGFTFHTVPFTADFAAFYRSYLEEKERFPDTRGKIFASPIPENNFSVSVMPDVTFDSLSFSIRARKYFAPMVEVGKYSEGYQMPVSITMNHAVADMYHLNILFENLQQALDHPDAWCNVEER